MAEGNLPSVIRPPQIMNAWTGFPLDTEFRGRRFTAFIAVDILEVLGNVDMKTRPTLQEYLTIFDDHRAIVLGGIRVAFERGVSWSHDGQQLRVRTVDVRELVPDKWWGKLVMVDPEVMGGVPCFGRTTQSSLRPM